MVRRRTESKEPTIYGHTINQSFDYFITLKKTEGVRERTMSDYVILFRYFTDWLKDNYPEISLIADIDTTILREYAVYLSEEIQY
jgi:integrase/recombinase XerD